MTKNDIEKFEKTATQLDSFYTETAVLVKKDPKTAMNKFKLNLINKILQNANEILGNLKPFDDFSEFDLNEIPNNGDVAMILGQYINCLEELRQKNVHFKAPFWYWSINDDNKNVEIRTYMPLKLNKK